jgi:hypothetical protein
MRKFLSLSLFFFCLLLVSGRLYSYAFGNVCSGNFNPSDPATAVDQTCLQCGKCSCGVDQNCQLKCPVPMLPGSLCAWTCTSNPSLCGGCQAAVAGKCGVSGGCGVCEKCLGTPYTCQLDQTGCESDPACYNYLHPPGNYICNGQGVDNCSQTNSCPADSCKSTCGSCGCSSGKYCGIYVTQIGATSVWECVDGSQPGGLCFNGGGGGGGISPGYDFNYGGLYFNNLEAVITPIAKILFYAALVIGALFIIYSGYILMTSEGNPQKVQQGQEQLTASVLGIIFVLLSAAILRVIINSIILGS